MKVRNSDRFLNAFARIEKHLRRTTASDHTIGFSALLTKARGRDASLRAYEVDLREYADLRNAIVHERSGGEPIAEPHDDVVRKIEGIADLITRPPGVEFFKGKVTSFNPDDPIALAVRAMYTKSYSQAPIYENGHFAGLLTTNTIARWLGAQASEDIFSLQETPIRDVLRFSENDDNHRFLPRKATLFDVMELFHAHERRGGRLDAVLITENGAPSEKPLGIITAWDLPKVLEAIHVGFQEN